MSQAEEIEANKQAWLAWIESMNSILLQLKEGIIGTVTEEPTTKPTKPSEGTIKEGGWGANTDTATWKIVNMKDHPELFKVVDSAGKNVATHFTTQAIAQQFIDYMKSIPKPDPPDVDPEEPTTEEGKGVDKYGVKLLYSDGKTVNYNHSKNFRDDGKRFDISAGKEMVDVELTGYFADHDGIDDEVSGKQRGGRHSNGTRPKTYDMGVDIKTGKPRYRTEDFHPEYEDGNVPNTIGDGKGIPLKDKYVGYKFICRNVDDNKAVNLQIWQDIGDNEGEKPANQWVQIANWVVKDPLWVTVADDHQETIRIDDPKGCPNLAYKWISAAKINQGAGVPNPNPNPPDGGPIVHPPVDPNTPLPTEQQQTWISIGRWDNKQAFTLTGHMQYSSDKTIALAAGGDSRKLEITGDGKALLSGNMARIYIFQNNYNGVLELKYIPKEGMDDLSLKLRSRHQEADPPENRFGGYGLSFFLTEAKYKRENYHNEHEKGEIQALPKPLENGKEYGVRFTCSGDNEVKIIGEIDYNDGKGFIKVAEFSDKAPLPYMKNKALYDKKSYAWIRVNGSDPKEIQIRDVVIKQLPS